MHDPQHALGIGEWPWPGGSKAPHLYPVGASRTLGPERGLAGLRPSDREGGSRCATRTSNLSEGHGRSGRIRLHHWRIAYASAKEVDSHLRLLCLSGAVHRGNATTALNLFDEVRALTWRLLHPIR